ncbi:MAG TPA: lysophospholipid acyltransferase family protein [Nevskiaceae bacterium]|nr:lysophospholipid acyltransferase family protein [Nevskiaceae bacterium]
MAKLARSIRRARRRFLFLSLQGLVRVAGFARARALGTLAGDVQWWLGFVARRRMVREVAHALGRPADDPQAAAVLREAFRVNDAAVFEILALFDRPIDAPTWLARCEIEGLDRLHAALAGGRGAILLATHSGNAALLAVALAHAGIGISVVYKHARMMSADFLERGFSLYGIQGILANEGIKAYGRMLSALKGGRVVFIMLDQGVKSPKDALVLPFLGKRLPMTPGPAQLARHARAPVLPATTIAARPVWRFAIEPEIARVAGATLEQDAEQLVRATESQILRFPHLWSWHQRRWRSFPVADG